MRADARPHADGGPRNQRNHRPKRKVDQDVSCQTQAHQPRKIRQDHLTPPLRSSLRLLRIFFSNSSSSAVSHWPTASTREEISKSPEACGEARKPATKSPARFCSHSWRVQRVAYTNARSHLRRTSRCFLKSRSRVVITVVYASGRPKRSTTSWTLLSPCVHNTSITRSSKWPSPSCITGAAPRIPIPRACSRVFPAPCDSGNR